MKSKYCLGDNISTGLIPCQECGNRHTETVIGTNPLQTSWASESGLGHAYREIPERVYIQMQRDQINELLKKLRKQP